MQRCVLLTAVLQVFVVAAACDADLMEYGDRDVLGTGTYINDPTDGASLTGLSAGQVTFGGPAVNHTFPFSPEPDDFAGTDQIYTSSNQTVGGDGYSQFAGRLPGPQVLIMDYSSLVEDHESITTLTLGIAADDFEFYLFGQPFVASINGVENQALSDVLNNFQLTNPQVRFFTIGVDVSLLNSNDELVLSIDQNGDGRDGWAVDFLTIGVTTVPEPGTMALSMILLLSALARRRV